MDLERPDQGLSHPATLTAQQIARVLRGILVEIPAVPFPLLRSEFVTRQRAFSEEELSFLAPLLAKGLSQATPEEVVTFYESRERDSQYRAITSGGIYVQGEYVYVILSNYRVKRPFWQDNEHYEAPFRLRPLVPIEPQPGRVLVEPASLMAHRLTRLPFALPVSKDWVVGVRYAAFETTP